ncbi:PaaI family thioesterase [Jongsikchunia kroppenstedtii]|uniref:PaaI family thioesterase n=1 Tax=Jongsikchunia kroppenstedtii TaxID=1121721 RepID=UPI0003719376|nr:PaaI family thioesterase [Jongsikchunia kroppenstedtii]
MTTELGTDADAMLDFAAKVLAAQPFSVFVGARMVEFGSGSATLGLDMADHHRQQHGYLHGGMIGYLADNALTFAGGSVLGPNVLTAGMTLDYLRPVTGPQVLAIAEVIDHTERMAVCRCRIVSVGAAGERTDCAHAQGTIRAAGRAQSSEQ